MHIKRSYLLGFILILSLLFGWFASYSFLDWTDSDFSPNIVRQILFGSLLSPTITHAQTVVLPPMPYEADWGAAQRYSFVMDAIFFVIVSCIGSLLAITVLDRLLLKTAYKTKITTQEFLYMNLFIFALNLFLGLVMYFNAIR